MNNNNLYILFLIEKSKTNSKGLCPIRCRLTFNKDRKMFSPGLFINPDHWDRKHQKLANYLDYADYTNKQLSLIRQKLNQAFLFLQVQEIDFDVLDIYKKYKGELPKKSNDLIRML